MLGRWGQVGVLLAIAGCAGGEDDDSGFVTTVPTTPTMPVGTTTGEPDPTEAASSSGAPTTGSPTTGGGGETTNGTTSGTTGGEGSSSGVEMSTSGGSNDTTGPGPSCGDGVLDPGEACDDGNAADDDACRNTCVVAACGDGVVQVGVEACDDGNAADNDACRNTCVAAACGDGVVQMGVEFCDEGPQNGMYEHCAVDCSKQGPSCGDKVVDANAGETCDDGNKQDGDGCSAMCKGECANQGGGSLQAENGTAMNKNYCYEPGDSIDTRARKACESHFGVGACCLIPGGYSGLQWGQCNGGGGPGTYHFHPDPHPNGHCAPNYIVGDVVSPGWCGVVLGNFLD